MNDIVAMPYFGSKPTSTKLDIPHIIKTAVGTWFSFSESKDKRKITHEDIAITSFAPLDEIRKDFLSSGYSEDVVDSLIVGLSELPEYEESNNYQTGKKEDR